MKKPLRVLAAIMCAAMAMGAVISIAKSDYTVTNNYHGQDAPIGATILVTAWTSDPTIQQVTFRWLTPEGAEARFGVDETPTPGDGGYYFTDSWIPTDVDGNPIGDWGVQAIFQADGGKEVGFASDVIAIKATSFFVVPEILLGTLGSTAVAFSGYGFLHHMKTRTRKKTA